MRRRSPFSPITSIILLLAAKPAGGQSLTSHPSSLDFVQSGVAPTADNLISGGAVCPEGATSPCILGPGLGVTVRMGYRARGPWYVGGAYQAARHDSSNILRLGVMQQLRGEARYLFDRGTRLSPYALGAVGAAAYGNEWGIDTAGPLLQLGAGLEFQISTTTVVGLGLVWRAIVLRAWTDGTGQRRAQDWFGVGLTQWAGLELTLEIRNPLPRW